MSFPVEKLLINTPSKAISSANRRYYDVSGEQRGGIQIYSPTRAPQCNTIYSTELNKYQREG